MRNALWLDLQDDLVAERIQRAAQVAHDEFDRALYALSIRRGIGGRK
jgi:hypothetical protein